MESPAGLIRAFPGQDCTAYDKTVDGIYNGEYIYKIHIDRERERERVRETVMHMSFSII